MLAAGQRIELPPEILFGKIVPLLDRTSYCRLASTCLHLHQSLLKSSSNLPPWPCRLNSRNYLGHLKTFAFASSGTAIACGYSDGTVRLWQLYTGEQKPLNGHWPGESVHAIVFGRSNDHILATASADHTILLWNLEFISCASSHTRVQIHSPTDPLRIHSANVSCLRFSADDTMLLSSHSSSETINFWSATTGSLLKTLSGPLSRVASMEISRGGKHLVATAYGEDHTYNCIRIWNLDDSTYETKRGGLHNVLGESVTDEDAFLVASVYQADSFHVWSSAKQEYKRRRGEFHHEPQERQQRQYRRRFANTYSHELAFFTGGSKVASVDDFRSIKIWRTQDGKLLSTFYEQDAVALYAISVCRNTRTMGAIVRTRVGAQSRNRNAVRLFQVHKDGDGD
jgi:WD40 repeat protein